MELKKVESLKIEIVKKCELDGTIYYSLFVNDSFQTLSRNESELTKKTEQIEAMFMAGEMDEKIIFTKELTR